MASEKSKAAAKLMVLSSVKLADYYALNEREYALAIISATIIIFGEFQKADDCQLTLDDLIPMMQAALPEVKAAVAQEQAKNATKH